MDGVRTSSRPRGDEAARAGRARRPARAPAAPLTLARRSRTRVYAVASGKGGVGKARSQPTSRWRWPNRRAGGGAGRGCLGLLGAAAIRGAPCPVALSELMLPVEAHGVALMSVGFFVNGDQPVVWRGPMLHKAIQQFVTDIYWGELDTLLVDLPPGTGDVTLSLLQLLPDSALLAVTTPQIAARVVATRVARMAPRPDAGRRGGREHVRRGVRPLRRAHRGLRRGGGARAGRGHRRAAARPGAPRHGGAEAGDRGVPVVVAAPEAGSARA